MMQSSGGSKLLLNHPDAKGICSLKLVVNKLLVHKLVVVEGLFDLMIYLLFSLVL